MKHCLKTTNPHFAEIANGNAPFVALKNDRNYKSGDTIFFQESDGKALTGKEEVELLAKFVRSDYEPGKFLGEGVANVWNMDTKKFEE